MGNHPFLGAHYQNGQTTFSVKSEYAEKIELCLFSPDEKRKPVSNCKKGKAISGQSPCRKSNPVKNTVTAHTENIIRRAVCF